jgi:hypothetical protein
VWAPDVGPPRETLTPTPTWTGPRLNDQNWTPQLNPVPFDRARRGLGHVGGAPAAWSAREIELQALAKLCSARPDTVCRSFPKISSALSAKVCGGSKSAKKAFDPFRWTFAEIYDHHLLPACRRTGLDAEEVMAILGENWFMTTVWGWAFEDFLTREDADGRNIIDDYLKRRGWKEGTSARTYMSALRASVMSLYEVSDIVRDTSFRARDLVRGGDPALPPTSLSASCAETLSMSASGTPLRLPASNERPSAVADSTT